ncbi:mitochondrial intermediate peptidase [Prorops nasuta]|uniref:mitochondrial intermediate peptidase n=1 Tax=Prorops nasuta TaxID=863751 RepID=UPI0034CFA986
MIRIFRKLLFSKLKVNRKVSSWSPLATSFNSTRKEKFNFRFKDTGLFQIPELKTADGFKILKHKAITQVDQLIDEATSLNRKRKIVEIFDELSDTLCKVADLAEFIRIAHPDEKFVRAAEDASISISGIVEKLNTHRDLYNALQKVIRNGDIMNTTAIDDHVSKLFLFDFEQSGIHLEERKREKVVQLNDYVLQIGQKFMAGAVTPRIVNAKALPDPIKQHFVMDNGNLIVQGLFTDSANTAVREAAYKLYLYPDKQQEQLLEMLLNSRHELAQLCGFPAYVHRAVKGSTVETPEVINQFLNFVNDELSTTATADYEEMQKMKDAESSGPLMPWDITYLVNRAKKNWLNTSSTEFSPYFSLGTCMDGLNILTQALYGIRLETVPVRNGEVWVESVHKLAVIDEQGGDILGYIYCDFYERERKPNQDCHFTIRGGKQLQDGSYQKPIVVLMLSLQSPRWGNPCLLSPMTVDNLFHEMGHALHSMLARTQYQHVTGTRCSTDFAEVPSILMEYFASDPRVVSLFAKHFQTQESIPENLLQKLSLTKNIFPASELQIQVFYSMLDHVYHSNKLERSSTKILEEIQGKYYGIPYVENTAWQLRFSHLVGYGAKYYSYLISRAISFWIWQTYFQADPLSRSAGEKYRRECLAYGGGKPPSALVLDFLNKEANATNFAKSLLNEIDIKYEQIKMIKR